jgi:hypothetical protein
MASQLPALQLGRGVEKIITLYFAGPEGRVFITLARNCYVQENNCIYDAAGSIPDYLFSRKKRFYAGEAFIQTEVRPSGKACANRWLP